MLPDTSHPYHHLLYSCKEDQSHIGSALHAHDSSRLHLQGLDPHLPLHCIYDDLRSDCGLLERQHLDPLRDYQRILWILGIYVQLWHALGNQRFSLLADRQSHRH